MRKKSLFKKTKSNNIKNSREFRSKIHNIKKSRKRTIKKSRRRTIKKSRKLRSRRRDGMKKTYELSEIKDKEKSIKNKSRLIHEFLYKNVGAPSHFRDFSETDIENFAILWENVFRDYKTLDDTLFNKLYSYAVIHKEFEAEEELFPTKYPSPRREIFHEGDKVHIKGGFDDNRYIITKLNIDDTANLTSYPYIPFYSNKNLINIPLKKIQKSEFIEKGLFGLGGKTSFGL